MVFEKTTCQHCGEFFRFPVEYGQVVFCSASCRISVVPPQMPWEYKGCTSSKYYSRRRKSRMLQGDKIDPLVVYASHSWTCALCCGSIDPTLQMPHPMSATIDHVIPLEEGGLHTWDNVQPAHKRCNEEKDQLRDQLKESIDSI